MLFVKITRDHPNATGGLCREMIIVCDHCSKFYNDRNTEGIAKVKFQPTAQLFCERCGRLSAKQTHPKKL